MACEGFEVLEGGQEGVGGGGLGGHGARRGGELMALGKDDLWGE